jgi:hypothetical protein
VKRTESAHLHPEESARCPVARRREAKPAEPRAVAQSLRTLACRSFSKTGYRFAVRGRASLQVSAGLCSGMQRNVSSRMAIFLQRHLWFRCVFVAVCKAVEWRAAKQTLAESWPCPVATVCGTSVAICRK